MSCEKSLYQTIIRIQLANKRFYVQVLRRKVATKYVAGLASVSINRDLKDNRWMRIRGLGFENLKERVGEKN